MNTLISASTPNALKSVVTQLFIAVLLGFFFPSNDRAQAATVQVSIVEGDQSHFTPKVLTIHPGDTVEWIWSDSKKHSVVSGDGNTGTADGIFNSGIHQAPYTYSVTFPNIGSFPYFCGVHYLLNKGGTWPVINVVAGSSGVLSNISTRVKVGIGSDALIGGFVVGGNGPKQLLLRVLGPTLTQLGITGALQDTTLELRNSSGVLIASNDNWGDAANAQSIPTNLRPPNPVESAILTSLYPGNYTAIARGKNNTTGVALIEGYDIDTGAASHLTNISSRGAVETGSNVMIAGIIVGIDNQKIIVRALGPTLSSFGVPNPLLNPAMELRDANGALLLANDNWKSTQQTEISSSGYAPPNDLEPAIVTMVAPGNYTAVVRGVNSTTGVALVEVYTLN
jgi:plastocyanin